MRYGTHNAGRRARAVPEDRPGQERANSLEAMWEASARRHREKLRRENAARWFTYFSNLADSLRRSAEEFERRAEALLDDDERRPK